MNRYDWYFRQRVSQGEMDQAFAWAEDADHSLALDNGVVGLVAGGAVTEQTPAPDLTVNVSALTAYGKSGERIAVSNPLSVVDLSVDEYGTATAVLTAGQERIISVFTRFHTALEAPAVDGNGLTVYTKQLEDAELFVRMGAAAAIGTATPPAVLGDALLLCDVTRAYGQLTVQTADIDLTRREDWLREAGTTITTFAHGTARAAIADLFEHVDALEGGGTAFAYTETWFGGAAVGLGTPPTTYEEAFNAVPHDLKSTGAGGANLIGTFAQAGWSLLLLSDNTDFTGGTVTNQDGGTAIVYDRLEASPGYVLVRGLAGTWTVGAGVDVGASYVAPHAYFMGRVDIDTILTASTSVQNVLLAAMQELAARPRIELDSPVTGRRYHYAGVLNARYHAAHCDLGGAGDPLGSLEALAQAPRLTTAGIWGLPYLTTESLGTGFDAVDLARGWDYERNAPCVYVSGASTNVRKVFLDPDSSGGSFSGFLRSEYGQLTIDTSGTLLSTLANHEPYAVACNGPYLFVLCQTSASGATAKVYCYDVRYWPTSGPLRYVWDTAVPSTTNCMGARKSNSRLVCDSTYVWGLLGAEDASTGTPLFRMDAATGLNPILGKGDGYATPGKTPTGGLAVSQDDALVYTVGDVSEYYAIGSTRGLAASTKGWKALNGQCRDILLPGWYFVFPQRQKGVESWIEIQSWDWANNVLFNPTRIDNTYVTTYRDVQATYDGSRMWIKLCDDYGAAAENHAVVGLHPAQIVHPTVGGRILACEQRYAITTPQTSGSVGTMGRMVAWGPGLWSIDVEEVSDFISFLPLNRTFG